MARAKYDRCPYCHPHCLLCPEIEKDIRSPRNWEILPVNLIHSPILVASPWDLTILEFSGDGNFDHALPVALPIDESIPLDGSDSGFPAAVSYIVWTYRYSVGAEDFIGEQKSIWQSQTRNLKVF